MVIAYRDDGLIDEDKLDKKEIDIFIMFLKHERNRHLEDISNINKTIKKLLGET